VKAIVIFYLLMQACLAAHADRIIYQAIPDCPPPHKQLEIFYANRDLSAASCYKFGSWEVLAISSDSNSWLDFKNGNKVYSTERAVVYDAGDKKFPNLADGKMEVHIKKTAISGIIFRVAYGETLKGSVLYSIRLDTGGAYYCGKANSNEKARALLAGGDSCQELPKENSINPAEK
jgi:hypothetical protein